MGRIIKFRAWLKAQKRMEGCVEISPFYVGDCDRFRWMHSEVELMQFTGLHDKNGKEIYEGDIIKQTYHAERGSVYDGTDISFDGHHIGEVVITTSKGVCMRKPLCYSEETDETIHTNQYKNVVRYRCEVIGNIYENPELNPGNLTECEILERPNS